MTSLKTVSTHTTARYPGWIWEKTEYRNGTEEWFGTKEGVGYAVAGTKALDGKIYGELYTRQTRYNSITWEPIKSGRNPYEGTMANCVKEAERRAEYHNSKSSAD